MISFDEAQAVYARTLTALPAERVAITAADGRVLREAVESGCDLPPFAQSAMDGYAYRDADAAAPSLQLIGRAEAGGQAPAVAAGECVRILTGAPLPDGADTVVPQENVELRGEQLHIVQRPPAGAHVRARGEELRHGQRIVDAGRRLTPGALAALAMAGIAEVTVARRPRVAVLVTGDEVRPPGQAASGSHIHDANGPMLAAFLRRQGADCVSLEYVPDVEARVDEALQAALASADLVISSGGASVGDKDFVPEAARRAGLDVHFWKVAQKPGKPLLFATGGGRALMALPGNPGAVFVGCHLHVTPVLSLLAGAMAPALAWRRAPLVGPLPSRGDRTQFLRVQVNDSDPGGVRLELLPHQASHMISNLVSARALARLDETADGNVLQYIELPM